MSESRDSIVLTGFEPFATFKANPSWEAARTFHDREIDSFTIRSFQIPLIFNEIKPRIIEIIDTQKPAAMINLGQSARPVISLEQVAVNLVDLTESTVLYNCGTRPRDQTLEVGAPKAYFSTLPLREIFNELQASNIPAEISYTAGTFGCNQLFYQSMHKIAKDRLNIPAGFIHVPCLPSQAAQLHKEKGRLIPSMDLNTTIEALEITIKTTLRRVRK
ncbi:MAG: pyroglutamyl-peptidase I [Candidatus Bathyarchaeota archaeon]|nr:MAG: pyroglutamyl-peptidase I [Candidatus Bathyarchaeota archaeon]